METEALKIRESSVVGSDWESWSAKSGGSWLPLLLSSVLTVCVLVLGVLSYGFVCRSCYAGTLFRIR